MKTWFPFLDLSAPSPICGHLKMVTFVEKCGRKILGGKICSNISFEELCQQTTFHFAPKIYESMQNRKGIESSRPKMCECSHWGRNNWWVSQKINSTCCPVAGKRTILKRIYWQIYRPFHWHMMIIRLIWNHALGIICCWGKFQTMDIPNMGR